MIEPGRPGRTGAGAPEQATFEDRDALGVKHLFTLRADTVSVPLTDLDGPAHVRRLVTVSEGRFTGSRLRGRVVPGASGDWVVVRPDGSFTLDVRMTLETEDGVMVYMAYQGVGRPRPAGGFMMHAAPRFEAPRGDYAWLDHVQAVAHGVSDPAGVTYVVYEMDWAGTDVPPPGELSTAADGR